VFCVYAQDDTEKWLCTEFSTEFADLAQSINFFEKVSYDLNTLFKIHLLCYQHASVSSC